MEFTIAKQEHFEALCAITEEAKRQLKTLGLDQWQKGYPSAEVWQGDIEKGVTWVAVEDGAVLGGFMFSTEPDPSYASIDGAWLTEGPYASFHRVCVADAVKGRGVAGALFAHGFALARAAGMPAVRIDTHGGNAPMKRALEKAGFRPCGEIILVGGCENGDPRDAYELVLNKLPEPCPLWQKRNK